MIFGPGNATQTSVSSVSIYPCSFPGQNGFLASQSPPIATQRTSVANHSVAWYEIGDRIASNSGRNCTYGFGMIDIACDLAIGDNLAGRNLQQRFPYPNLQVCSLHMQHDRAVCVASLLNARLMIDSVRQGFSENRAAFHSDRSSLSPLSSSWKLNQHSPLSVAAARQVPKGVECQPYSMDSESPYFLYCSGVIA